MADNGADGRGWQVGKSLKECFSSLLENESMCDVTFNLVHPNGTKDVIRAHRLVLSARSPVFEAMLAGNFAESSNDVEIVDADKGPFLEMLKYIYSEDVTLTGGNVLQILNLGRKYIIDGLVEECRKFCSEKITTDNVSEILTYSVHYGEEELVAKCIKFIWSKASEVLQNANFLEISKEALKMFLMYDIILEGPIPIAECEILKAVLKWIEHQKHDGTMVPRDVLGECIYCLRCVDITIDDFTTYLGDSSLLTDNEKCTWFCYLVSKCEMYGKRLEKLGFNPRSRCTLFQRGARLIANAQPRAEIFELTATKPVLLKQFGVYGGSSGQTTNVTVDVHDPTDDKHHSFRTTFTADNSDRIHRICVPDPVEIRPGTTYKVTASVDASTGCAHPSASSYALSDGGSVNIKQIQYATYISDTYYNSASNCFIIGNIIFG